MDKCLHAMTLGKAAGSDGIEIMHMVNAHLMLDFILATLFIAMLQHGYVPDNFGKGIIIPLIKHKSSDASSSSNYRGITFGTNISPIVFVGKCLLNTLQPRIFNFGLKNALVADMLFMPWVYC